jgi:hypothetical protein
MSKRKAYKWRLLLWRILEWEGRYRPTLGPLRLSVELGLQNFHVSLQVTDGDRPPCYTRFLSFDVSTYALCSAIVYAWRLRHVRTINYTHGEAVVFGNGQTATVDHDYRDGTVVVVVGAGSNRVNHRVSADQIRRATK